VKTQITRRVASSAHDSSVKSRAKSNLRAQDWNAFSTTQSFSHTLGRKEPVVSTLNLNPGVNVAGPLLRIWPRAKLAVTGFGLRRRARRLTGTQFRCMPWRVLRAWKEMCIGRIQVQSWIRRMCTLLISPKIPGPMSNTALIAELYGFSAVNSSYSQCIRWGRTAFRRI
jgi:hypothetical protein